MFYDSVLTPHSFNSFIAIVYVTDACNSHQFQWKTLNLASYPIKYCHMLVTIHEVWLNIEFIESLYEGESINRSQMDTKRKMWYSNLEKTFISRHILHQHWYTCPIALPVRRNLHHISFLTVISATSAPQYQRLCHQRNVCHPVVNCFTWQTFPIINRKHFFMNILCIESFCP
jgi:hypothetical protein